MKKMFKRTISTAVFAALVLSSVTALPFGKKAKKTSKIEYTQFNDVEKKTDKSGKVYDLGGMSIAIVDWWSGKNAEDIPANSPAEEETRAFHKWHAACTNASHIRCLSDVCPTLSPIWLRRLSDAFSNPVPMRVRCLRRCAR